MEGKLPLGVHVEDDNFIAGGLHKRPKSVLIDLRHRPDSRSGRIQVRSCYECVPLAEARGGAAQVPASRRPTIGPVQGPIQRAGRGIATGRRTRPDRGGGEGKPERHFDPKKKGKSGLRQTGGSEK